MSKSNKRIGVRHHANKKQQKRKRVYKESRYGEKGPFLPDRKHKLRKIRRTKGKGKFVGWCPKCNQVLMDEDILTENKKIVPKYLCSHCSKVVKAKTVLPTSKVFGEFFFVKETKVTYFKVIAKGLHQAIKDIREDYILRGNDSIVQIGPAHRKWKARRAKKEWILGPDMVISIRTKFSPRKRKSNDKVIVSKKLSEPPKLKASVQLKSECNSGSKRQRKECPPKSTVVDSLQQAFGERIHFPLEQPSNCTS